MRLRVDLSLGISTGANSSVTHCDVDITTATYSAFAVARPEPNHISGVQQRRVENDTPVSSTTSHRYQIHAWRHEETAHFVLSEPLFMCMYNFNFHLPPHRIRRRIKHRPTDGLTDLLERYATFTGCFFFSNFFTSSVSLSSGYKKCYSSRRKISSPNDPKTVTEQGGGEGNNFKCALLMHINNGSVALKTIKQFFELYESAHISTYLTIYLSTCLSD